MHTPRHTPPHTPHTPHLSPAPHVYKPSPHRHVHTPHIHAPHTTQCTHIHTHNLQRTGHKQYPPHAPHHTTHTHTHPTHTHAPHTHTTLTHHTRKHTHSPPEPRGAGPGGWSLSSHFPRSRVQNPRCVLVKSRPRALHCRHCLTPLATLRDELWYGSFKRAPVP